MITQSKTFRSVAETVVPEVRDLSDDAWRNLVAIVDHAIAQRPVSMQRQLGFFMRALNLLAFFKYGRTVNRLIPAMRAEFLADLEKSRLVLLRRGFWGLRTLVFMGYYARPEAMVAIGYRARSGGWQTR